MKNAHRLSAFYVLTFCAIIVLVMLSFSLGAVHISFAELTAALCGDTAGSAYKILRFVRLPRVCAAVLCGAALAASGAIIQSVLHNPLGSPNVLGMNAGAGLSVMVCAAFFPFVPNLLPFAAFFGAFVTLLLVCALGKHAGNSKTAVLLSGVAANTFFIALTDAVTVFVPDTIHSRTAFKIGSLSGVQMNVLVPAAVVIILSVIIAFFLRDELDVLALGDESAHSLGLPVGAVRFCALVLAALLCGAGISFAGLVGFVGLIVPHCARVFVGGEMRRLLPASVLLGAALVLLCDLLSRLVFAPYELPVGILLSVIGGPFFVVLLLKEKRSKHD
ncbi:MAG: iron ABC transporter permease [Treponema sp.]|nr:iron ABC transporter permease [Treponema sp.]